MVDPSKIEAVANWQAPTSVTEVRNLMRLVTYYSRSGKHIYKIVRTMTTLIGNDIKLEWAMIVGRHFRH